MNKNVDKPPMSLPVTRSYESSRHQDASLAAAFERALPIARRRVGAAPSPDAARRRTRVAVGG
jgi:hypothetical protein